MAFSLPFSLPVSILPYSLKETAELAKGKALLQSTGLNWAVKISSNRIELWTCLSFRVCLGFYRIAQEWLKWVCSLPWSIWLTSLSSSALQQQQGTLLRKPGYLNWPKVPVGLDHQRVLEGFLNRLHWKCILYPLTHHIFFQKWSSWWRVKPLIYFSQWDVSNRRFMSRKHPFPHFFPV